MAKTKILWLDCDEVLLDFIREFNKFLGTKGHYVAYEYMPEKWGAWAGIEQGDFGNLMQEFINHYSGNLPRLAKAEQLCRKARELGWHVNVITAHPSHLTKERLDNLSSEGLVFDGFYSTVSFGPDGKKFSIYKHDVAGHMPGDINVLVDDRFQTAKAWAESKSLPGAYAVTVSRSYNSDDILEYLSYLGRVFPDNLLVSSPGSNADEGASNMQEDAWRLIQKLDHEDSVSTLKEIAEIRSRSGHYTLLGE